MPNKDNNFSPEKLKRASKIASKKNTAPKLLDSIEEGVLRAFRWLSVVIDKFLFSSKNTVLLATIIAVTLYVSVYASKTNISSALSSSKTISNVTISARYNSESFELSGLPTSCSVVITGDAANVNNASTRNGYCLLNLEGYTEGTHTIKITAANYGDSVNTVVTPSEAQITLKRKNGQTEYLKCKAGLVLAGMEDIIYKAQNAKLEPGDVIYLYTDGVVEAHNLKKELYGEERLLKLITNSGDDISMKELCKKVYDDVKAFADGAEQFDDITMLALKYKGYKPEE